jgi:catechol 2,3-dioxygenase-like lactoylglutathione lyase family enzyme
VPSYTTRMTTWLPVTNLDRSQLFYKDVLNLSLVFENKDLGWAEFQLGSPDVHLALHSFDYLDEIPTNGGATIRLFVDNLPETIEELREKGVVFVTDIHRMDGQLRICDFIDPDGNTIQLAEELNRKKEK